MDDAQIEMNTAIETARTALAAFNEKPTPERFRIYRDASEIAIKWHRAVRLGGGEPQSAEDELEAIVG